MSPEQRRERLLTYRQELGISLRAIERRRIELLALVAAADELLEQLPAEPMTESELRAIWGDRR